SVESLDGLGGAVPIDLRQGTGLAPNSSVGLAFFLGTSFISTFVGKETSIQRQWNLVDTVSYSLGRHQLKFGVDYRRLTPFAVPEPVGATFYFFSSAAVQANTADFEGVGAEGAAYPLYKNFSAFGEDQWKVSQRLSLTFGLRWEVNPPPGATRGLLPFTIQGSNPDTLTAAPQGTPLWHTSWLNLAPRLGAAYLLRDQAGWETVVRG